MRIRFLISAMALAASMSGTAERMISQPASSSSWICRTVALTSRVSVLVIDCTVTSASPPTLTPPTYTGLVTLRWFTVIFVTAVRGKRCGELENPDLWLPIIHDGPMQVLPRGGCRVAQSNLFRGNRRMPERVPKMRLRYNMDVNVRPTRRRVPATIGVIASQNLTSGRW